LPPGGKLITKVGLYRFVLYVNYSILDVFIFLLNFIRVTSVYHIYFLLDYVILEILCHHTNFIFRVIFSFHGPSFSAVDSWVQLICIICASFASVFFCL